MGADGESVQEDGEGDEVEVASEEETVAVEVVAETLSEEVVETGHQDAGLVLDLLTAVVADRRRVTGRVRNVATATLHAERNVTDARLQNLVVDTVEENDEAVIEGAMKGETETGETIEGMIAGVVIVGTTEGGTTGEVVGSEVGEEGVVVATCVTVTGLVPSAG